MPGGSSKLKKAALAAVMAAGFVLAGFMQNELNQQRYEEELTRVRPLENAPPVLAFTTKALGGFRGLIANALWIRATEMQEQGKYFEMVQLADWITKLEPNLASVWIHQAWNMSYNISVKFNDHEDRWLWVQRGIELLRDQALRYNPNEPELYRELAWHFQHKMGHFLDDAHELYKYKWAMRMDEVLGEGKGVDWDALINPDTPEERERARRLREEYKMDPVFMKKVDEKYGPLEWRLPESHAIYWAALGLERTKDQELTKEDLIGLRRVIFQSLQLAFVRGRLIYPGDSREQFLYGPNLEIIRQTSDAYLAQAELEPDMRDNILNAHKNFLGQAVYHLYTHNRRQAANQWFDYLNDQYPDAVKTKDLDDYALSRIAEEVGGTDVNKVKTIIMGAFETAFINYAIGEDDVAVNHELFAQRLWERYMREISGYEKTLKRVGLEPLPQIREQTLRGVLSPEYGLDPVLRARLLSRLGRSPEEFAPRQPEEGQGTGTNAPPAAAGG